MSIESAITTILQRIDPKVIQLPFEGDRPTGDYMGFQPMLIVPQRSAAKAKVDNGDSTFTQANYYQAEMTISVNAYGEKGYNRLIQLHGAKEDFRTRNTLAPEHMALITVGSPRNLSALGDEGYRTRWQADVSFNIRVQTSFVDYQLKQFIITGQWVNGDDVMTITTIAPDVV